jgi:hypothetical protein
VTRDGQVAKFPEEGGHWSARRSESAVGALAAIGRGLPVGDRGIDYAPNWRLKVPFRSGGCIDRREIFGRHRRGRFCKQPIERGSVKPGQIEIEVTGLQLRQQSTQCRFVGFGQCPELPLLMRINLLPPQARARGCSCTFWNPARRLSTVGVSSPNHGDDLRQPRPLRAQRERTSWRRRSPIPIFRSPSPRSGKLREEAAHGVGRHETKQPGEQPKDEPGPG